jgi:small conductance mechanosensitive channel
MKLLRNIAMQVRNSEQFKSEFVADPQVLGIDSLKGSQLIFPVIFKTLPTKQYGPMREFQRRVRLALEQNHMLPGDPNRVFATFQPEAANSAQLTASALAVRSQTEPQPQPARDPTTLKPHDGNPFTGE